MKHNIPRTPFSTRLSDSCRETELRIRNILSGPKKRPPLPLIILIAALCLFCGNLVSCHVTKPPEAPVIVMETQYYDRYDNLVEIPALALPAGTENEAVDSINAALNTLREEYAFAQHSIAGDNKCLFYPSTTDRHLNLLFFEDYFKTDLNTGHVFSLVYDLKEGTVVSTQDALALAGLNEKGLLEQVDGLVQARLDLSSQELGFPLALHNLTLEGFRIRADGQPVFYLTGREDDADDSLRDGVSGADQLYIWEDRAVTIYDQYGLSTPLVPAEETDQLDPPLWNQWYFAGEKPKNGYSPAPVSSQSAADLRFTLLGERTFTDAETGLVLDIGRVTETVTSTPDFTARPARFAYLDLDQDGTEEAVVWLITEEGDPALAFLVLRWQEGGQVYSYTRFPRSFQKLKQDGVFQFSSSAAEFGAGFARFIPNQRGSGPDQWVTEILLEQERVNGNWDHLVWYYAGAPVSEADFNILYQEQDTKVDVVWHSFDLETIERVIS